MKKMNILQNNRLMQLAAMFMMMFGANSFSMRMTPEGQYREKIFIKKLQAQLQEQKNEEQLQEQKNKERNELIAANWSQEKIREFRQKRDPFTKDRLYPEGKLVYSVKYSKFQELSSAEEAFNDILIDHYSKQIYAALQTVPLQDRVEWADELHLILAIGLKNFLAGGKKRFEAGLLGMIDFADDGSEIGILGTKYEALKKVKSETDNFATIPFDATSVRIDPVNFFTILLKGSFVHQQPVARKRIGAVKKRVVAKSEKTETEMQKELEEAFMPGEKIATGIKTEEEIEGAFVVENSVVQKVKSWLSWLFGR